MKRGLLEIQNAIEILKDRGKNVLLIGPTGVGKTHITNSIAPNNLKAYLNIREGEGLATLKSTTIVLSDYIGLSDDELVITGRINTINKNDRNVTSECEKLLLDLIYEPTKSAEKDLTKNGNYEKASIVFKDEVELQIDNLKVYMDNTMLSFIIQNIENYENELKDSLFNNNIDYKKLIQIFIDIYRRLRLNAKGKDMKRLFIDEVTTISSQYIPKNKNEEDNQYQDINMNIVRRLIDTLVDTIVSLYNNASCELLESIKNASDTNVDEENRNFTLVVNSENYNNNSELLKKIIGVTNDTRSYFVDNPTIYSKKDFNTILNDGVTYYPDYYKTFVANDVEYHSMRIIDTQGLFHKNEDAESEYERIIDLLSTHHCNDIIYVISAKNDALTKKAKEVLKYLKNYCKKNINVNLVVTHIDEKILSKLNSSSNGDFDDFDAQYVNVDNVLTDVINEQNAELKNELKNPDNDGKVNIDYDNITYFSYPTHKESIDKLIKGQYDYMSNVNRLLLKVAKNSKTYYIELKSDELPLLDINKTIDNVMYQDNGQLIAYDISNIFKNISNNYYLLFGTPKEPPLKIHHRTYEESLINWKYYATKFISFAKGSETGYAPIETYFVEYIRTFIRESIVPRSKIDLNNVEFKDQNVETTKRFNNELMNYLKVEVSKQVTIDIYNVTILGHGAVYNYRIDFMNILIECAKSFFPSESISLIDGDNLKNKGQDELNEYFALDKSNGLAKVIILTIHEINNAIEQFVKNYCVVRF